MESSEVESQVRTARAWAGTRSIHELLSICNRPTLVFMKKYILDARFGFSHTYIVAVLLARGVHPPWGHDAFSLPVSDFPPIFEIFLDFLEN